MIHDVRFTPGSDRDVESGLLAFIRLQYGSLVLDGLTLRRTREGGLSVSWPERRDRNGGRHPIARPRTDAARRELEDAILRALYEHEARP